MEDKITRWENPPSLPPTHYVDNRIFTDPEIFSEERDGKDWRIKERCVNVQTRMFRTPTPTPL